MKKVKNMSSFFRVYFSGMIFIFSFLISSCKEEENICNPNPQQSISYTTKLADNHHAVYTDIIINARKERVWAVLTNWSTMPNWSTSFQGLSGDIRNGGKVLATFIAIDPTTGSPFSIDFPHLLIYQEGVSYGWADPLILAPGMTDNHTYRVEAISETQTRFIQTDEFKGTNPDFTTEFLATLSLAGYNQFNAELKREVEK